MLLCAEVACTITTEPINLFWCWWWMQPFLFDVQIISRSSQSSWSLLELWYQVGLHRNQYTAGFMNTDTSVTASRSNPERVLESRCYSRFIQVSGCRKPDEQSELLSLSWCVVERENQQRWEGFQRVQPSSNPDLRIEFQHELKPMCLREYIINGFHESWKGHCTKKWASCVMLKQPRVAMSWETLWMFR